MITIVSGLPRSGTSLMMQMLVAGGMSALSDGGRKAAADNPRGYLEWEQIKQLPQDPGCIAEAEGKVVKVVARLILSLPAGHEYRIIFMQRPLPEVIVSEDEMLRRRGTYKKGADPAYISSAFEKHLREVYVLNDKSHVKTLACLTTTFSSSRTSSDRRLRSSSASNRNGERWQSKSRHRSTASG